MKKAVLLSFLLSMFFLNSFAQTKEELVGTWTVSKVIPPKLKPGNEMESWMKKAETTLVNSTFQLDADGKCNLSIIDMMAKDADMKMPATTWVYNEIDKSINVFEGAGKKKESILKLYVKKDGKKYTFVADEMMVQFEVKKNKK